MHRRIDDDENAALADHLPAACAAADEDDYDYDVYYLLPMHAPSQLLSEHLVLEYLGEVRLVSFLSIQPSQPVDPSNNRLHRPPSTVQPNTAQPSTAQLKTAWIARSASGCVLPEASS